MRWSNIVYGGDGDDADDGDNDNDNDDDDDDAAVVTTSPTMTTMTMMMTVANYQLVVLLQSHFFELESRKVFPRQYLWGRENVSLGSYRNTSAKRR